MAAKLMVAGAIFLVGGIGLFSWARGDHEVSVAVAALMAVGAMLVALSFVVGYLAKAIRAQGDATREEIWRLRGTKGKPGEPEEGPPVS